MFAVGAIVDFFLAVSSVFNIVFPLYLIGEDL
jgi:hypothetical protein